MMMAIVGIFLMLLLFAGMGGGIYYAINKTNPNKLDTSVNDNAQTVQEFIPVQNIQDSMLDLGGHNYRAIIECSSINYRLRTEKEKEIIEMSFQRFLNSLSFPITMFIQTRTIDNSSMLNYLKDDLEHTVEEFPNLAEYANVFYKEMSGLDTGHENNKQKKKYIIVQYNEASTLEKLSEEEKYEYSLKELAQRCQILIDGLSPVGVNAKILSTGELIELIYSTYNKDNYSDVSEIINGNYMGLMVEGKNKLKTITNEGRVDWILYEAENRLDADILQGNVPNDVKGEVAKLIKAIEELRTKHAGYYKTDVSEMMDNNNQENTFKIDVDED